MSATTGSISTPQAEPGRASIASPRAPADDYTDKMSSAICGTIELRDDGYQWRSYFAAQFGEKMCLFKTEHSTAPTKILTITYAHEEKFDSVAMDEFIVANPQLGNKITAQKNEHRVCVYHEENGGGCMTMKQLKKEEEAEEAEHNIWWLETLQEMLVEQYSTAELLEKKAASEEMAPAMFEQVTAEYATSRHLVANLIESGFGEDFKVTDLQGIVTAGYVHPMQSDEKIKYGKASVKLHKDATGELVQEAHWRKMYFVLLPDHLYAFKHAADQAASGHLTTTNVAISRTGPASMLITTPLRSLELRLAHEFELFEWLRAVMKSSSRNDAGPLAKAIYKELEAQQNQILTSRPPIDEKGMELLVHYIDREKLSSPDKFVLKTGKNVVGRDGAVQIYIEDGSLSRAHCRIDITKERQCKIVDIGSSNGMSVNGKKIVSQCGLTSGDVLVLGTGVLATVGVGKKDEFEWAVTELKRLDDAANKKKEAKKTRLTEVALPAPLFSDNDGSSFGADALGLVDDNDDAGGGF